MSTTMHVTYEQYEEMIQRGDFAESNDRYELLLGEIRVMPLPDPRHEVLIDILSEWSFESLPRREVWVRGQQSLGIPALASMPLPDLAWVRRLDYARQRPLPADVLLLVEVSGGTLSRDRNQKARLYAQAGIADYWIVNVRKRRLEIRRGPEGEVYRTVLTLAPGDEARPLAFPEVALPVSRLFPS